MSAPPDFWRCTTCGCFWRDNHDNTVSLANQHEKSCKACEWNPTDTQCEPLYRAQPEADSAVFPRDERPTSEGPREGSSSSSSNSSTRAAAVARSAPHKEKAENKDL